jgi:hypothetical protein
MPVILAVHTHGDIVTTTPLLETEGSAMHRNEMDMRSSIRSRNGNWSKGFTEVKAVSMPQLRLAPKGT